VKKCFNTKPHSWHKKFTLIQLNHLKGDCLVKVSTRTNLPSNSPTISKRKTNYPKSLKWMLRRLTSTLYQELRVKSTILLSQTMFNCFLTDRFNLRCSSHSRNFSSVKSWFKKLSRNLPFQKILKCYLPS
jgi:hypothetical protein